MPYYAVSAIDRQGIRRSLREAAPDEPSLREKLRAAALWPVTIRPLAPSRQSARLRLPVGDFIPLLHQLELQLRAGVNADVALAHLAEDSPPGPARTMLAHIHREVAQGRPIHEACRHFSRQFPPHLAAVIAAGEASAQLPESLRALAEHLAGSDELKRTARRALIYPTIVLVATAGLIVFLLGGVVPKFAEIFISLHLTLPAVTVVLIRTSTFVRVAWPALIVAALLLVGLLWLAARTPKLRRVRDALSLRLPVLGETIRCLATARFAAHCRLLHEAGIPLLDSLATAADLVNHEVLAGQLRRARESVALGRPLYASLPAGHDFPGFIVPALKAGETTGQLAAALKHIEDYASRRAKERLATALALLEPTLLAGLTAVVGAIALSFFLPLFSLLGGLNAH
ncbi:MAG: type II secretion system F family protein [Lacunisphaera sp.]|nr:type II secretion system F family protein [Lacunisphaera sp.]